MQIHVTHMRTSSLIFICTVIMSELIAIVLEWHLWVRALKTAVLRPAANKKQTEHSKLQGRNAGQKI